eukprot:COSAG01_NODE_2915_length_6861_cov_2.886128_2_plen_2005_part_01
MSLAAGRGGYAVVAGVVLRTDDCGRSFRGFELSGYTTEAACVSAVFARRAECQGASAPAAPSAAACTARVAVKPQLTREGWAGYCGVGAAFDRSAVVCEAAGTTVGYSHAVTLALAMGHFGSTGGVLRSCSPDCVWGAGGAGWSWDGGRGCWMAAAISHPCMQNNGAASAAQAELQSLCPLRASEALVTSGYLGAPATSSLRRYSAANGGGEAPDPTSTLGGGWKRSDGANHDLAAFQLSAQVTFQGSSRTYPLFSERAVSDGGRKGWSMEDLSSGRAAVANYHRSISSKERDLARTCGWKLRARVRVVSQEQFHTHHVTVKLDRSTRFAFYFGKDSTGGAYLKTGLFNQYALTVGGLDMSNVCKRLGAGIVPCNSLNQCVPRAACSSYFDVMAVFDPQQDASGVLIYVDGSTQPLNPQPYVQETSQYGVPQAIQWGVSSTVGKAVADFNLVEWQLLDRPSCHQQFSRMYAGCMDTRYDNYDPSAGMPAWNSTVARPASGYDKTAGCVDTTPPMLTLLGPATAVINQFDVFNDSWAVAYDAADGNISTEITVNTTVPVGVFGTFVLRYSVQDKAGNSAAESYRVVTVLEFDECLSRPCQNGAICSQTVALPSYTAAQQVVICSCKAGWNGSSCANDIDECASNPCVNGGNCTDSAHGPQGTSAACDAIGSAFVSCSSGAESLACVPHRARTGCRIELDAYQCNCVAGYSGVNCDIDINECSSLPCRNGGKCFESSNVCVASTVLSKCVAVGFVNAGLRTCIPRPNVPHDAYSCSCSDGFEGQHCEIDTDECASAPCANGGTCSDSTKVANMTTHFQGFNCSCSAGFYGSLCQFDVDECSSNPCLHGTCYDSCSAAHASDSCSALKMSACSIGDCCVPFRNISVNTFYCDCRPGYNGTRCEIDVNECESHPCANGVCIESMTCLAGAESTGCDAVNMATCQNGSCVPRISIDSFQCICPAGWDGILCADDVDECVSSPCQNGAMCGESSTCSTSMDLVQSDPSSWSKHDADCAAVALVACDGGGCVPKLPVDHYVCVCLAGFSGETCGVDIDECASNPCRNGARCEHLGPDKYNCTCLAGFSGEHCENDVNECTSMPCVNGGHCFESNTNQYASSKFSCTDKSLGTGKSGLCSRNNGNKTECLSQSACHWVDKVPDGADHCNVRQSRCAALGMDICDEGFCVPVGSCAVNTCPMNIRVTSFECVCLAGFQGSLCQIDVNECASNPCKHGKCTESQTCGTKTENDNDCSMVPGMIGCLGGATLNETGLCVPANTTGNLHGTINSFACTCELGWTGSYCNIDINECASGPCQNGGICQESGLWAQAIDPGCIAVGLNSSCSDGSCVVEDSACPTVPINMYRCTCASGWNGANCNQDVNECDSAPCAHNSSCVDSNSNMQPCGSCKSMGSMTECTIGSYNGSCVVAQKCTYDETIDQNCYNVAIDAYQCVCKSGWQGENCTVDVDDCSSNPCQNGANCTDTGENAFSCRCAYGWTGVTCTKSVDLCATYEDDCDSRAVCNHTGPGTHSCTCAVGFEGSGVRGAGGCSDYNECQSSPCQNGGSCADSAYFRKPNGMPITALGVFACGCVSGWHGSLCENDWNECTSNPCRFGVCSESTSNGSVAINSYHCACNVRGWGGYNCFDDIDECQSHPCRNGATCDDSSTDSQIAVGAFKCRCAAGWLGSVCSVDVDECNSLPCLNAGTCADSSHASLCQASANDCIFVSMVFCSSINACVPAMDADQYRCYCKAGWNGINCGIDVDECANRPCVNGQCTESQTCAIGPTNNACNSVTGLVACRDGSGHCVPENTTHTFHAGMNSYSCLCEAGWSGMDCDIDANECISSPCRNGGSCIESSANASVSPNAYRCVCGPGFANGFCTYDFISEYLTHCSVSESTFGLGSGNCDIDVNECVSQPCRNGANCTDSSNDIFVPRHAYKCTCAAGFVNGFCDYRFIDQYANKCNVTHSVKGLAGNCDLDANECISSPCRNGGSCIESSANASVSPNAYRCV